MIAHTPGPWSTKRSGSRHAVKAGSLIVASAAPLLFEGEQEANANLIAAAPELLEALQVFAERSSSEETITITVSTAHVERARAAIAKATGEAA